MKRITVPLLVGITVAAVGCGKTEETPVTGSTALSISGSLKSSTAAMLNASRIDQYDAWAANAPQYSMLVAYSDFIVSCVTFSVPPVAGSGGSVGSDGKFTVTFPDGTVGQSFGCFISKPADTNFDPIPMVFKDSTKKAMNGEAKKDTRIAVTGSISIPEVKLDLESGTAEVDTSTIVKTETNTTTDVVKTVAGTKFDFSGTWVIESLAANNIPLPAGYKAVCTFDEMFEEEWNRISTQNWNAPRNCDGPQVGMQLYMLRMAGKNWVQDDACKAAVALNKASGTPVASCGGSAGAEDRYAIKIWAGKEGGGDLDGCRPIAQGGNKDTCRASMQAMVTGMSPKVAYHGCGRKMGFTNTEAKAFGEVDFSADSNYASVGSSAGADDTKYYEGAFPFANAVTVPADQAQGGVCNSSPCKPFRTAGANTLTDGWKVQTAQTEWVQQNNCKPVDVLVGGKPAKAWRCYGNVYPNCTEQPHQGDCTNKTGAIAAFNEGAGGGCMAGDKPIQFDNWHEYWCQWNDADCNNNCQNSGDVSWLVDGQAVAAGYSVQTCSPKAGFVPRRNNQAVEYSGTITCKSGGSLFKASNNSTTFEGITNPWEKFRPKMEAAGALCSDMPTNAVDQAEQNRQKLAQLQCYANAYHRVRSKITGCVREVRFNWGTQNPWEFVAHNDGPDKARGEVIFELFNYTDTNSGTFSTVESDQMGVQVKDSNGYDTWVPCRVNRAETITLTSISASKAVIEISSVSSLANKDNATCVAAAENNQIDVGTSKQMFVISKQ